MRRVRAGKRQVLLCGAGLSRGTLGSRIAPTSAGFGKVLSAPEFEWDRRFPFLRAAVAYLSKQAGVDPNEWGLDEVWDGIDENLKLRRIIRHADFDWPTPPYPTGLYDQYRDRSWNNFWVLAGVELKQAVAMIYGLQLEDSIDAKTLKDSWIVDQIRRLRRDDMIVTTNYDLLIEGAVRIARSAPEYRNCLKKQEFEDRKRSNTPAIAKLHGSLDWVFATNWVTGRSYVSRTPDGRSMPWEEIGLQPSFWEKRPLLVAPVQHKDEVLFPENQPGEVVEVLTTQWMRFMQSLKETDKLIVAGYGFPSEDSYGMRMIQEALGRRSRDRKIRVELWLGKKDMNKVARRLEEGVFGRAFEVKPMQPIPGL